MTDFDDALTDAADLDLPAMLEPPQPDEAHPERPVWLDPIDDDGQPHPWAQQDDEHDNHYAYFQFYCSLSPAKRTYAEVARHYDRPNLHTIPKDNDWPTRVAAWDAERARIYQLEVFEELQEMGERQGNILKDSIEAIAIPLQVMAEKMRANPEAVMEELGEKNLTQLHSMAIKSARALPNMMQTERLVRGLPTEITANIHSGKVEHVHSPNLEEVSAILQGLHDAGAIQLDGGAIIDVDEELDAADESVHQDYADAETDGLPPPQ
jgi:hypothetical protein